MKKSIVAVLIILGLSTLINAQELEISGMLRSQHAIGLESGEVHETRETLNMELEYWGERGSMHISPYLNVNPLTDIGDQPEWGVREAYIDLFGDYLDLRIGKQVVFWGQAEGAFITDVVSPQNLSAFILADFEEIRIGVPAVKATAYLGPMTLETIWIQKFVPSIFPSMNSVWRTSLMPDLSDTELPEGNLENSEIFARASIFGAEMTLEMVGGYGWNDLPVAEGSPMDPDLVYHRSAMVGGILTTTLGPLGIRAEGAITLDRPFSLLQAGTPPVLVSEEHHFVQGLIGLDGNLWNINLSAQYILQYVNNFNSALVNQEEVTQIATFRIQRKFLDDRLTTSLFTYFGFNPIDSLLRPEVSYWIEDGLEVSIGSDIFIGESEGRFGVYEENSQITASVRWYF